MLDSFSVAWMAPSAIQRRSYRRQCCVRSVLSFRKLWTICAHVKRPLTDQRDVRVVPCVRGTLEKLSTCCLLAALWAEEAATQAGGAAHHGIMKHEGSFTERAVTLPCAPVTCLPLKSAQNAPTGPPWRASSATTLMAK